MLDRVVLTLGTFDLLHSGHLNLLYECRKFATSKGIVVAAVNSDAFVQSYRGVAPVMNETERMRVVGAVRYVDRVVLNDRPQSEVIVKALDKCLDKFIVVGSDWASKNYYEQIGVTREWLDWAGISIVYVPYTPGISSTDLRDRVLQRGQI